MTTRYEELCPAGFEAIVIGGSAGAFQVLRSLLPALSKMKDLPVLLVVHLPPDRPSVLAEILGRESPLPCKEAEDKERLAPGTIYVAPPGYHLLVEADRSLALSVDDPVHYSRPSIDVLFESAAEVFRDRLLGVVLSGASQDGAAGLEAIRAAGGVALVQSPATAEAPTMPEAALQACPTSLVMSKEEMAALFAGRGGTDGR